MTDTIPNSRRATDSTPQQSNNQTIQQSNDSTIKRSNNPTIKRPAPRSVRLSSSAYSPAASRAEERARRRRNRDDALAARNRTLFRNILLALAAIVAVALLADFRNLAERFQKARTPGGIPTPGDAASILATLSTAPRYQDPAGHFTVAVPPNWRRLTPSADSIFDAAFAGPYGMEMDIQCYVTNGLSFERLVGRLKTLEHSMAADSHIEVMKINDWKVAKRSLQLYKNKILMLDFLTGDLAHHLQFVIPPALYDTYEPVFLSLVRETYLPGTIISP